MMAPRSSKPVQKHFLPHWVRWGIIFTVLLIVLCGTVLWIIQGTQAIIPIAVLTSLSILLALLQVLPLFFPNERHIEHSPSQLRQDGQQQTTSTSLPEHPPSLPSQISNFASHPQIEQNTKNLSPVRPKLEWGEAPFIEHFYGRDNELMNLKQWIIDDGCQTIVILGMGGIGKSSLAARLVNHTKDAFTFIFWYSLRNAPPPKTMLQDCIHFISEETELPEEIDRQISSLITYLREHRCLIILDNLESVLQQGQFTGQYREGYEIYGRLFRSIGETKHQSCLLLTSREKPGEIALLEGKNSSVRTLQLSGMGQLEGTELLKEKDLFGVDEVWKTLIYFYSGNPLALKLVSGFIREVFKGDIARFLKEGEHFFRDIYDLLDQQFDRLSNTEQKIMYWLAIEREALSLDDLQTDLHSPISRRELLDALNSLIRRSIIEIDATTFFYLQPVVLEYVTNKFIERVYNEITSVEKISLIGSHALIKAQAKDYIRSIQIRLILRPIVELLLTRLGRDKSEEKLKNALSLLRTEQYESIEYAAGNIVNLLIQLQVGLHAYDFTNLVIKQAYLQGASLPDTNFAYAEFAESIFTDTFGSIFSVAFSPNGERLAAGTDNGEIRLWDVVNGKPILSCEGHTDWVRSVVFSPDGKLLASGSDDQTVRLWDVNSGQCLKVLQGHVNWVWSVAFSPDGKLVASGSADRSIRLWNANNGQCARILQGHEGGVLR